MDKYLVGSYLLGLSNQKDNDYLVIGEKPKDISLFNADEDIRFRKEEELKGCLRFENNSFGWIYNYQLDQVINPSFATYYSYNILDYKDKLKERLKNVVKNKSYNFNKILTQGDGCCSKIIYHIAYNTFILENNNPIITAEQKAIIQDIHDLKKPIAYLDELAAKINAL